MERYSHGYWGTNQQWHSIQFSIYDYFGFDPEAASRLVVMLDGPS